MKTKALTLLMPFLFVTFIGLAGNKTGMFGKDKKEERKVSDFTEISISVPADVELRQGDECKLVLDGDEDVLEKIETKVRGDELVIKSNRRFNFGWNEEITIYITVKNIEEINVAGSADVVAKTDISAKEIEFGISGSGKVHIPSLNATSIQASISGSGRVELGGNETAEKLELGISGSGKFEAENLQVKEADIDISGSGKGYVHVTDMLEVDISGSGRVYYSGNPTINADISGSGKVRSAD